MRHLLYQQDGAAYVKNVVKDIFGLFKDGKIKPVIDSTWALEDVRMMRVLIMSLSLTFNSF